MTQSEIINQLYVESKALQSTLERISTLEMRLKEAANPESAIDLAVNESARLWVVPIDAITGDSRVEVVCLARWTAYAILQFNHRWNHIQIAAKFRKDRTSILYGIDSILDRCAKENFRNKISEVIPTIQTHLNSR